MDARTRRYTDAAGRATYATPGAVRGQVGGDLAIYVCNTCDEQVLWATSARTGGRYLVNVSRGYQGQAFYRGSDLHRCDEVLARREAAVAAEAEARQAAVTLAASMLATLDELLATDALDEAAYEAAAAPWRRELEAAEARLAEYA
jgi:hypothetical protein